MSRRKPPKRAPVMVDVILTIEARAPFVREDVQRQMELLGWALVGEADGPSLRLTYKVPIRGE